MSLPKEPRQLMINLMYLVLTAMLALNVSSEILHAFKTINNSVSKSNDAINGKNNETLLAFQANEQMDGQYERVHPYNVKAQEISKEADKVYQYLENWKERVIAEAGGYDIENGEKTIKREDDINASTRLLVENKGGDSIKAQLEALRKYMLDRVSDSSRKMIGQQLAIQIVDPKPNDNNPQGDWSTGNFYNMPTLAAVTLFAKMQNDIRNSEAIVIQRLFDEANAKQIKFDAITAIAVPKTSYALQGQKVEAEIMVAAYNKSVNPSISSSSGQIKIENGVGHWTGSAAGVGMQTVRGQITLDLGSRKITQPWDFQYMVGSTGASIQLDKMNVFYIGVQNPITVSAAGYSMEDVSIAIPGAEVHPDPSRGKGAYNISVTKPGDIFASIIAKKREGGTAEVGKMKIRVKYIPDPEPQVGGKSGGLMAASVFRVQTGVAAVLKNFDFELSYKVTSFTVSVSKRRDPDIKGPFAVSNSPLFSANPTLKAIQEQLKPGDIVYIDDIKAQGPDGRQRSLPTIAFKLN